MLTDDLPPELAVMARIIGREKTLHLAGVYGDRTMYVPLKPSAKHRLTQIIGLEDAEKLAKEYAGIALKIPRCAHIERRHRNESIIYLYLQGKYSKTDLAQMFKVCERTVHNLVRAYNRPKPMQMRQLTVFGGHLDILPTLSKKHGKKRRTARVKLTPGQLSLCK